MWGNRLGWSISVVILIGYVVLFVWASHGLNTASAPTEFVRNANYIAPVALPVAPVVALPAMTVQQDAGPLYRQAVEHYRQNQDAYDAFLRGRPGSRGALPPADVRGVELLIEATSYARMDFFASRPGQVVTYGSKPDLEGLVAIGEVAVRLSLVRQAAGQSAEAMRLAEAAFSLGAKLFDERLTYAELMAGQRLMGDGAVQMAKLARAAGDAARSDAIARFNMARQEHFRTHLDPVARVLNSIDGSIVRRHAGDVFYFAGQSAERVWRVEAILALGRMKYFVGEDGRAGDQRAARRAIERYLTDPDPVVQTAANAANDLTIEQYRTLW